MSALHKLPVIVAAALVCLSLTTTGSLALCIGTVFYFMRVGISRLFFSLIHCRFV
jgi:hypothetical protein